MKMRLCEKCGRSLIEIDGVWMCPRGHEVSQSTINTAQLQRDRETGLAYQAGAIIFKGNSKGRTKKKKNTFKELYLII